MRLQLYRARLYVVSYWWINVAQDDTASAGSRKRAQGTVSVAAERMVSGLACRPQYGDLLRVERCWAIGQLQ